MAYWLSKILGFLVQPSSLAAIAIAFGIRTLVRQPSSRWGRRLAVGGLVYYLIAGIVPVGNVLVVPLEQRFAAVPVPETRDNFKGIIILGGFEDGWVTAGRGMLAVNESAERLTEGLRLALRLPATKVVFSGGVGGLWPGGAMATGPVRDYLTAGGVDPARIVLEGRSRNTHENALFSAGMLRPKAGERWLLVTSAYHMPRAIGLYRKAGFDVTAFPVDYRTRDPADILRPFERIPAGLQRTDLAVNEWIGLVSYRLLGRIDDVFPGP